ncbi:spore germination protein [Alkalihalobacterium alkalinitrilicum]|uniref:spore germination protein n=1 Tax=Alkalihalobacterium alkalinitrilicum TaxID=427920 RepID=UPI000994C173
MIKKHKIQKGKTAKVPDQMLDKLSNKKLTTDLEQSLETIQHVLGMNDDFFIRRFHVFGQYKAAVVYFENLNDIGVINKDILKLFMNAPKNLGNQSITLEQLKNIIFYDTLYFAESKLESNISRIVQSLMEGHTTVLIDGLEEAFLLETRNVEKRSIENPDTERVIRGPREGFIEQLQPNLALLRYRLQTTDFRITTMRLGRITKSKVALCYVEGIAEPALVEEVKDRLSAIDIDGIQDSGYLEQFIEDNHLSPFPQIQNSERPDKAVAAMLEGKVVLLVDGSPFALIAPAVFNQFYQTTEDYSERFLMGSLVRIVRLIALVFALFFPAIYVSIIAYNPELIPTDFAVAVASGRAGVPFPTILEVLIMEVAMEVLREATIRLPQQVGGALSIVGVLVIGQAAVEAGFVSPITVVVIALTTIGSFATPAYNAAIALRMLRFPLVIIAGIFGLYGVMIGFILIMNHMLSLNSFGVPYMSPIVPGDFQGMKDTVVRSPLWSMTKRPGQFHSQNQERLGENVVEQLNQEPSNTLNPQAGTKRWDD